MLVHAVFSHTDMAKLVAKDYHIATQPFHRFRKGGNRVFDCLCQLSDSGFQFTKQSVVCFDLSVYLAAVRDDSLPFQRTGENALMNGWLFVQSPFCMAAVVNAFFIAVPFQITICHICPRLAPLDKLFFAVPTLGDRILPSVFRAFRVFADSFISVLFRFGGRQIYLLAAGLVRVLFKQYDVEFVSCTEKFDTSTPMGRAMLNICIVFAQLERESIQMRVQDAFYSRCAKGYYMRGRTPYGFDTEPIVMDGIKTKKLVENAEMDFAELMFQMYAEPGNSYGDITRYFVKHSIKVYDKALQRAFISKLLRNPVYVQADMDIYEYFKAQGVKIESPPEMFTGDNSCYLYQGREGEEPILVIAPHQGRIPSQLWLTVQRKLSQNTTFQNGRKCHNTWLAGKIKCGRCGYALTALRAQNGVVYLRCKQRADNGSCEGAGTLTAQSMEAFVYGEMVKKMRKFHTLKGGKEQSYNPKLTAARVALAKTESEIEKLLDTLSGANPLLLQYANTRIEELDAERQKQLRLVADLTANSVSASQIDSITGYLDDWESVSFDDKRKVVDILISQIDATSESVTIHWKI